MQGSGSITVLEVSSLATAQSCADSFSASLQILGIIPRTPSPPLVLPLEMRDPCSLSQAEAIELVRILREENKTQKVCDKHY